MAHLVLDHITKIFNDENDKIRAVDDLDVKIDKGEFVVFVGPSGCGKTTSLRCIAGFEEPTEGDIILNDEPITQQTPQKRDIAMVFQSYALYPHKTVHGNMSFGLEQSTDLPQDQIDERVRETAEMLNISELLDRRPGDLSGGQQQRVALGRAVVRDPEVFLMDEPLSNLDAKLRAEMRTYLQQLQADLNVTTVYVTHDQTEAMTMGDRIVVLNDGRLQQFGTPRECYYEPENLFVAGFIGEPSMNFFEMTVDQDRLNADVFACELPGRVSSQLDTDRVTLGIRPEHIEIDDSDPAEDENVFRSQISVVEHVGREKHLYFPHPAESSEHFIAITDGRRPLETGQEVAVRIPRESIYLFDETTNEALYHSNVSEQEMRI